MIKYFCILIFIYTCTCTLKTEWMIVLKNDTMISSNSTVFTLLTDSFNYDYYSSFKISIQPNYFSFIPVVTCYVLSPFELDRYNCMCQMWENGSRINVIKALPHDIKIIVVGE